MNKEYQFSEIFLKPKKTIVASRKECDPSINFGRHTFKTPIIPANMKSVVSDDTCEYLAQKGWFYINHRFGEFTLPFLERMENKGLVKSISVGVNDDSYDMLKKIECECLCPDYITLDIANGYSTKGEAMVRYIKDYFDAFLIVGNCCTSEAVQEIQSWGADAIKVGISNGNVCTTYNATGFGRPQFSTVLDCVSVAKVPIISDGGCKEIGDFNKAFVGGATMVMAGSLFAGFDESAGEIIEIEKKKYKQYFGSASYNNKLHRGNVEGKCILVDYKGKMEYYLEDVEDGIRSGISYAGGRDLSAFNGVEWSTR